MSIKIHPKRGLLMDFSISISTNQEMGKYLDGVTSHIASLPGILLSRVSMRGSGSIINRFSNMEKRLTGITKGASINDVIIFQGEGFKN